jgi:hypothetical protein
MEAPDRGWWSVEDCLDALVEVLEQRGESVLSVRFLPALLENKESAVRERGLRLAGRLVGLNRREAGEA